MNKDQSKGVTGGTQGTHVTNQPVPASAPVISPLSDPVPATVVGGSKSESKPIHSSTGDPQKGDPNKK